jgi:hypothetical protein
MLSATAIPRPDFIELSTDRALALVISMKMVSSESARRGRTFASAPHVVGSLELPARSRGPPTRAACEQLPRCSISHWLWLKPKQRVGQAAFTAGSRTAQTDHRTTGRPARWAGSGTHNTGNSNRG